MIDYWAENGHYIAQEQRTIALLAAQESRTIREQGRMWRLATTLHTIFPDTEPPLEETNA